MHHRLAVRRVSARQHPLDPAALVANRADHRVDNSRTRGSRAASSSLTGVDQERRVVGVRLHDRPDRPVPFIGVRRHEHADRRRLVPARSAKANAEDTIENNRSAP